MSKNNFVFVVDDDASARRGMVRLLTKTEHIVRDFASLTGFIKALETGVSGCLILDSKMPGMSGDELLEELASREVNLSLIIISASDDRASKRKSLEMKAEGFFRKPVDGNALLDAINWVLSSRARDVDQKNTNFN